MSGNEKRDENNRERVFSFRRERAKYEENKERKKQQAAQLLHLREEQIVNPRVVAFCNKIDADYVRHRSSHSNFQLKQGVNKKSLMYFNQSLKVPIALSKIINQVQQQKQKKKQKKIDLIKRRRKIRELFVNSVRIVMKRLKQMKMTPSDILQLGVFDKTPYRHGRLIFEAVKAGEDLKAFRLIIENRSSVFSYDHTGKTPLMWACIRGYHTIVQFLLEQGAPTTPQDQQKKSAITHAIKNKNTVCFKLLIIYLAEVKESDHKETLRDPQLKIISQLTASIKNFLPHFEIPKRIKLFQDKLQYGK